jgi:predicted acetyltransferase
MFSDLQSIYQGFAQGRNLPLVRTNDNRFTKENRFTYVYYQDGLPSAYVVYSTSKELCVNHYENTLLTVREMAYTSPDALREIFSFLRMFEGEFDQIELGDASLCPEAELLLEHCTHTSYRTVPDLMARVLNTEKMLASNPYPKKEGAFSLRVEDNLPTVAGSFRVEFGGGDCRVTRLEPSAPVDLVLTVGTFTQLIYGYRQINAETARYVNGAELLNDCEDFFRAFPKRACGIFEHF